MRCSFFVAASVLISMFMAMALASAVVSHSTQMQHAKLVSVRVIPELSSTAGI
jgi:hypothetical protein